MQLVPFCVAHTDVGALAGPPKLPTCKMPMHSGYKMASKRTDGIALVPAMQRPVICDRYASLRMPQDRGRLSNMATTANLIYTQGACLVIVKHETEGNPKQRSAISNRMT